MSLKLKAAAFGVAAALVAGAALPALAATAFATSNVNVRSCGSTDCRVVDVLRRGDRVDVDFCRGSWCAIENFNGRDGWVSASYLSRDYDDDYFDDYYDDDFYIVPRRTRVFPIYPRYRDPDFSACIGGPNARFCVYD
jgi:uncharacterized protein YraI